MKSFSNTLLAFRPALLATAALLSLSVADIAAASPEWVDMGPIAGSVQGHVWSKVVDEVGNTQGRAESWTLQQGVPSKIVVTLRTPDPGSVEVRMNMRYPDGDTGFLQLPYPGKEIPGGYQQVIDRIIPGPKPTDKTNALFSITVFPTRTSTDQRYQLLVEITPLSGSAQPTTSAPSASVEAMAAKMQGVWKRYNNGTWLETLEVGRDAQGWRVRGVEPNGKTNIYRILSQGDGWLEVSRPFGFDYGSRIRLDANGKLYWETYRKADRSHVWTGSYDREAQPNATPPSPTTSAPLRNLARGRPAQQSSTYVGTGVDQSAYHAVDGLTGGRDPHDLILTAYQDNPWWQVDLGRQASIAKVRLYNRRNPELRTNLHMVVQVSDDGGAWQTVYRHDASTWNVLDVPVGRAGRFVRVALTNHDSLQLYEVEVWGRMP